MVGTSLAQYEILEKIGEGGMGEVYRARDTRLGREVAIKVLPKSFAQDAERLARFEREAKLLAALNHANIATLYSFEEEDGTRFLAMELVEGETLAERIARGGIPIDEALSWLRQIASALEAAHDKGIIHRDLKPANIKITPEGQIKVLDFGLAKAFNGDDGVDAVSSMSPTLTKGTALGAILGTAAYMSPEQAKGKAVDPRADIWAFGCVVFEVLTGKRAFHGEDVSETLAAVLRDEPDWKALPASTPASVHRLLRRSLTKKLADRLAHIRDARLELDDTTSEPATREKPRASARTTVLIGLIGLIAGSLVTGVAMWMATRPESARTTRLVLENPTDVPLALETNHPDITIAPDGSYIVF